MRSLVTLMLLSVTTAAVAGNVPCDATVRFARTPFRIAFEGSGGGIFFEARLNGSAERLMFYFDSGAGRTLLDTAAAKRLGIRATESSTIGGAGSGRTPVKVARNATMAFGGIEVRNLTLNLMDLGELAGSWGHRLDGIIGYDVLCGSVVTVDFAAHQLTFTSPEQFTPRTTAESLPLEVEGRWPYIHAELKVPGRPAVTDRFLIDSGSADAVDHPIIKESTGPLRKTQTGVGIGHPVDGAIGPNEWLRLGRFTIRSTQTACCSGNPADDRVIGNAILSRFVVTFDYRHGRLLLEGQ
jgi:hypothetical protein